MEFTSENTGAKIVINVCSFEDAFQLKSLIEKALLDNGIKLETAIESDIAAIVMALDSSKGVFDAMFKCLVKSTYNNVKITKETFEDEKAREDLYDIFFYCLKVNIYPFFKPLLSRFGISLEAPAKGEPLASV